MNNSSTPSASEKEVTLFDLKDDRGEILDSPCADFMGQEIGLVSCGDVFYYKRGRLEDVQVEAIFYKLAEKLGCKKGIANVAKRLTAAARYRLLIPPYKPDPTKIHVEGGTITVDLNTGRHQFTTKEEFTLNRLNVEYDPTVTDMPTMNKFLSELLIEGDILTLQEWFGYGLVPTLKAQKFLYLVGAKGGEGKSQVGLILKEILGKSCYYGASLDQLQTNDFALAPLENILLAVDDDASSSKFKDTKRLASLVTTPYQKLERKGVDAREFTNYSRIMACGNVVISGLYDRSDAIARRMLLIKVKPKPEGRVDDRDLLDKLKSEKTAIFNWALKGLERLISNNWDFTISDRSREAIEETQEDNDNIRGFLLDDSVVEFTDDDSDGVPTAELYSKYQVWCTSNAEKPTTEKSFSSYLKMFSEHYGIRYTQKVPGSRKRGYRGIRVVKEGNR